MNIISIHTSHDGSITIVKNNKLLIHTQIDRFNNIIASAMPSLKLIKKIKDLNIKFDLVLFSFLRDSCHWFWEEQLHKYNLLKKKYKFLYFEDKNHHYFHSMCAKATIGTNKYTVVIDGHGSPLKENKFEQETIFKNKKIIYSSNKNIGWDYECKTAEILNIKIGRAFRSCGKLMALSCYDSRINKFQKRTEQLIKEIMPIKNVSYTGGVAQNVLANSQFLNYKNFKIDPLCTDQGISLGVMNHFLKGKLKLKNKVYLGFKPNYNLEIFKEYSIKNIKLYEICKILKNNPVAIFQGRSEQGQRGLGNRSLLMDATNPKAVSLVNKIKKREWYRPFAPAILEEYAKEYYNVNKNSPYMLYVFKAKKIISSITSIDGTSRIQTVNRKNNLHFYNLLKEFNKLYKIPLLLNTSLNLSGHTLVEDLEDVYYMMKYGNLKYCYLPDIGKLLFNPR